MSAKPKAVRDAARTEQASEAAEYYASEGQVAIAELAVPDEAKLRWDAESLGRAHAATRQRMPSKLSGRLEPYQADYAAAFRAEKRKRAWPNAWKGDQR